MTAINRLALLVLGVGLIIGSVLGSEYAFGSKVMATDTDVGKPLAAIPQAPVSIQIWDVGANPAWYDDQDIVYLHIAPPAAPIAANDIRLTPYGSHPAGSKVTPFDNDIGGTPLLVYFGNIMWLDLYGVVGQIDLRDPILFEDVLVPIESDLNDVRLTTSEGTPPGTMLSNSDPDFGKLYAVPPLAALVNGPIPPARIEYFDRNANNLYDYPDDVYFHTGVIPTLPGRVNVGDVRLSGPVY